MPLGHLLATRASISHLASQNSSYEIQNIILPTIAQLVKNSPAMQDTWVLSLGWKDPLEKGRATENAMDCIVQGVAKSRP